MALKPPKTNHLHQKNVEITHILTAATPLYCVMSLTVTHIIALEEAATERDLAGGVATHLGQLLRGLIQTGVKVELIALLKSNGLNIEGFLSDLERSNINVTRVNTGHTPDGWILFKQLYALLSQRRDNIIHTHLQLASTAGRAAAFAARCAAVVDTWHAATPYEGMSYIKLHVLDMFTDTTIAISNQVMAYLTGSLALNPLKIQIVRYGIKSPEVLIPRETARTDLGLPAEGFCIGYVGNLARYKNIPLLLEAIEKMDGVTLCIIGSGEEESHLRQRVVDFNLSNVIFTGHKDKAADLMSAFDLVVLPSRAEENATQLLEAMIRHIPVAGSTNGVIPDLLGNGDFGFLFNTAQDLRSIIERLVKDVSWAEERVAAAYQNVMSEYTLHAMIEKTRRIYSHLSHRA